MSRTRAIRLLVVVAALLVLIAVADRVSAVFAEKAAASYLSKRADFAKTPSVVVHGVPFLTQAIRGRYTDIEVVSGEVKLASVSASNVDVHLRGAHLPLSDVLGGSIRQLACDSVDGSVTFTYQELAALSQVPGLALSDSNGQLSATASLLIPGNATAMTVQAVVSIQIVSGALRLQVSKLSVTGLDLPQATVAALSATFSTPIPIPALPFGLAIDGATPTAGGVVVHGSGHDVVISATS